MPRKFHDIVLYGMAVLSLIVFTGCGRTSRVISRVLLKVARERPSETHENPEWGQVDVQAINDYLSGVTCHYSEGIVVGLGEFHDDISLKRFGRRFPVIITTSTGDGNLADLDYYAVYGLEGNRDLESLYFDDCLYVHSGGSVYNIRANRIIYLDPAFGRPTLPGLNRTVSDLTSIEPGELRDSSGITTVGFTFHDFRFFRGICNVLAEGFKFTDHEAQNQFKVLGFDLNGDNEKCQIIDEPKWETRFYDYDTETDSWILVKTLPGIGYPQEQ